jgi:hypothetical protein
MGDLSKSPSITSFLLVLQTAKNFPLENSHIVEMQTSNLFGT